MVGLGRSIRRRYRTSIAAGLCVAMAVSGSSLPAMGQSPSPSEEPLPTVDQLLGTSPSFSLPADSDWATDSVLTVPSVEPIELGYGAIARRAQALFRAMPAADWGPAGRAAALDYDPLAAFAFVRDSIGLDVYPGQLRGARGAIAARSGNPVDRALLLKSMLDRMLVPARFAVGELDQATAERVVQRAYDAPVVALPDPLVDPAETGDLAILARRARRDYASLRTALGDRLRPMPTAADPMGDIREHVWVQAFYGTRWVDMDPTFPDARVGDVLATATRVLDAVPDEMIQRVHVRVLGTVADGAPPSEQVLLDQILEASDVADRDVYLAFQPSVDRLGGTILDALGGSTDWRPVLMAGADPILGTSVPILPGEDVFSGTSDGPELASLRLEIGVEVPGRAPDLALRTLMDRTPPGLGAGEPLDPKALTPWTMRDGWPVELLAIHHLQVSTGGFDARAHQAWRRVAARFSQVVDADPAAAAEEFGFPDAALPLTVSDEALVGTSERLIALAGAGDPDVRMYVDQPRVYLSTLAPRRAGGVDIETDLMVDSVRVLARGQDSVTLAAAYQVWYGTLQAGLETQLLMLRMVAGGLPLDLITGASLSLDRGPGVTVLDASSIPVGAPADLTASLGDGQQALVAGPVMGATAWWTVDPTDGTTRAVLAPNLGGARGPYVNSRPPGGRISVLDPNPGRAASRGEMQKAINDAVKQVENQRRPPPSGACRIGGAEYTALTCAIIVVGALAFVVLGIYVLYRILFV